MVNQEELAICRRRGHDVLHWSSDRLWHQCTACGMWVREKIEEREDEPPKKEQGFRKSS